MSKLDEHSSVRVLQLITTGRKSGLERKAPMWFVVDQGAVLVQAGPRGQKGWYANIGANPRVRIELGGTTFSGLAESVADTAERERIAALFRAKYWLARVAGWVGSQIGRGRPVRIQITGE